MEMDDSVNYTYYYSDSSSDFTTYSENERYLKQLKDIQDEELNVENCRKYKFEEIANQQQYEIFNLQGLNIMKFTYVKIKFCYQPSLLYKYISKKLMFYCSLKYLKRYKKWIIKREPMPAKPLFLKVTSKSVLIDDSLTEICKVIYKIYIELRKWSETEIKYRRNKFQRYRAGELSYLDIDSTDEELYFDDDERQALFEKRQAVLKRMIPPPPRTKQPSRNISKKTKLKYKI